MGHGLVAAPSQTDTEAAIGMKETEETFFLQKQSNPYPPILCSLIPSRAPPPQTSARFALISPPDALVRGLSAPTTGYGLAGPGRSHGAREFHPELEEAEDYAFLGREVDEARHRRGVRPQHGCGGRRAFLPESRDEVDVTMTSYFYPSVPSLYPLRLHLLRPRGYLPSTASPAIVLRRGANEEAVQSTPTPSPLLKEFISSIAVAG
ncbi:hypothetical protein OsI_23774 [Oryza sativa Indica Group]|uniref:Uncharacterized protein n=1 Tax=Oryza sativa subsp. indica TaxID=39946 RepID=B8B0E8_ORYSI|nr:hypothetical protein OsI_23774 [Oryza sativa Indica Group]